jgi:hypothetical protein
MFLEGSLIGWDRRALQLKLCAKARYNSPTIKYILLVDIFQQEIGKTLLNAS